MYKIEWEVQIAITLHVQIYSSNHWILQILKLYLNPHTLSHYTEDAMTLDRLTDKSWGERLDFHLFERITAVAFENQRSAAPICEEILRFYLILVLQKKQI